MTIPLQETQRIKIPVSKPGYMNDSFVRVQDINNCIGECKKDIELDFPNKDINKIIFDKIEKWLSVKI